MCGVSAGCGSRHHRDGRARLHGAAPRGVLRTGWGGCSSSQVICAAAGGASGGDAVFVLVLLVVF